MENKNPYDIPLGGANNIQEPIDEEFPWEKIFDSKNKKVPEEVGDIKTRGKIYKTPIDPKDITAPIDAINRARGDKTYAEKKQAAKETEMDMSVKAVNTAQRKEREKLKNLLLSYQKRKNTKEIRKKENELQHLL